MWPIGRRKVRSRCVVLTTVHRRRDTRIFLKQILSVRATFDDVRLVVADGGGSETTPEGVKVIDIGPLPSNHLGRAVLGISKACRLLLGIRPQLLHFHDPELIPVGLVMKSVGCRVIYDVHENVPLQVMSKTWILVALRGPVAFAVRVMEWLAASAFDIIVTATPAIGSRFPRRKTVVVQNFPIVSELRSSEPHPYQERRRHVCYVGGLTEIRGAREIVAALGQLPTGADVRLQLAGNIAPAALQKELQARSEWRLVHHHGMLDRSDLAKLLGEVRAGLVTFHPAPNHMDSQPTKLFEYMSAGLPVIASDFPLWREIILGSGCGIVVDPQDSLAIAEAITWIMKNPEEAEAMGRRGLQAVKETYSWSVEADKLIAAYDRLLPSGELAEQSDLV